MLEHAPVKKNFSIILSKQSRVHPTASSFILLDDLVYIFSLSVMAPEKAAHVEMDEFAPKGDLAGHGEMIELSDHDKKVARRLKRKIDAWILPMITGIYFLAAMDRSDIGNAQSAGMQADIGATDAEWSRVVSLFYVGFILGQAGGVYTLRSATPQIVLGTAVIVWGVALASMIAVKTAAQAEGIRIIIGFCEGLDHAALLYLSLWYTPKELATRSGVFYSASSLAGAFNGLISFGIVTDYQHKPPFQPWQWLFLVEGCMSMGFGILVIIFLPPVPEKVKFGFSADDRRMAIVRTQQAHNTPGAKIRWKSVPSAFADPMLYIYTLLLIGTQVCLSSLSSFLPALVTSMGYSSTRAQLMTVPVYACAFVSTLFFTWISDKTRARGPWLVFLACVSLIGLVILRSVLDNHPARYAAICLAAIGMYPSVMIITTWLAINTRNYTHRATASAVTNMLAQAVVACAVLAFTSQPFYLKGLTISLAFVAMMIPVAAVGIFYVKWTNSKKVKLLASNAQEVRELRAKPLEELGSKHPEFVLEI